MDSHKRVVDIYERTGDFDSIGLRHIDIEQQAQPTNDAPVTSLVPNNFYYGCVIFSLISITCSVLVVSASSTEVNVCFSNDTFLSNRLLLVVPPAFHIFYSCALRNIPTRNHLYHSVFGFLCSVIYFATIVYLIFHSWNCSTSYERIDGLASLSAATLWVMMWLYFSLTTFYLQFLKENPLQLLLFIRCVCIPPEVKKVLLVLPYVVASATLFIEVGQQRYSP